MKSYIVPLHACLLPYGYKSKACKFNVHPQNIIVLVIIYILYFFYLNFDLKLIFRWLTLFPFLNANLVDIYTVYGKFWIHLLSEWKQD